MKKSILLLLMASIAWGCGDSTTKQIIKKQQPAKKPKVEDAKGVVVLTPIKDSTLVEDATGDVANGSGSSFIAGRTNQGMGSIRRGLVAFDVAGSIPEDSVIDSAVLTMHVQQVSDDSPETVSLYAVTQDWGEGSSQSSTGQGATSQDGDSTWVHAFYDTAVWDQPGGDYVAEVTASKDVVDFDVSYQWESQQLLADVAAWLHDPSQNFGWIVVGNELESGTTKKFFSRESSTPPTLTIHYTEMTRVTESVLIPASQDNSLIESADGGVSNGQGEIMFVGRTNQGSNNKRRGLIRFDLEGPLPAGATVEDATVVLKTGTFNNASPQDISLHKTQSDWGEGSSSASNGQGGISQNDDATWVHAFYNAVVWNNPGGDYAVDSSASQTVDLANATYEWTSPSLIEDVQSWLSAPSENFGWTLIGNESAAQTTKVFHTREHATSYPVLEITYSYLVPNE